MMFLQKTEIAILALLLLAVGCSNKSDADVDNSGAGAVKQTDSVVSGDVYEYQMSDIPFDLNGKPVTLAGVTFTPASQWNDLGASGMREASYTYGPLENDPDSATMNVFYFGKTEGGSIEANLKRWVSQMQMPDGRDPQDAKIQYTKEFGGMNVHILTIMGTYMASMGGPMSGKAVAKENYRLIAAVIEAPEGNVFLKLTGPEYTARIMTEAFMTMIQQIKK